MIKWSYGDYSNETLSEYFENDDEDEHHDVEYPKHTLQAIALALVRIAHSLEALQSNR
tara:strand:- start:59 stop:232 length:174 start_codon:yes stop_codon:yes gene_type:complete